MGAEGHYARGPGQQRSRGPVFEIYADTGAYDRDCDGDDGCGVKAREFCIWPDTGEERKIPCRSRRTNKETTP